MKKNTISIDLYSPSFGTPNIYFNEIDTNSALLEIHIKSRGTALKLTSLNKVYIAITKPHGGTATTLCNVVDIDRGIVDVLIPNDVLRVRGRRRFAIAIYERVADGESKIVGSTESEFIVSSSTIPMNNISMTKDDSYPILVDLIDEVYSMKEKIQDDLDKIDSQLTESTEMLNEIIVHEETIRESEEHRTVGEEERTTSEQQRVTSEETRKASEIKREESTINAIKRLDDKVATVKDGKSISYNWEGTQLGIKQDGEESFTYVELKGQTGATGAKGETGAKGDQGEKGDIGLTGATGAKGETGAKGDQGEKGDIGLTGATGAKGDQGEKGDIGLTGATGAKGDQGEKGDIGLTGATGAKGDQGDIGPAGAKGDTGAKGDPGTVNIDDDAVSTDSTWSSSKINSIVNASYVEEKNTDQLKAISQALIARPGDTIDYRSLAYIAYPEDYKEGLEYMSK